jgi:hypothetical protein
MMISADTLFPARLTKIDELTRGDHAFLKDGDECLFFGDYSARKGFSHSATNQLILNFKMPVQHRSTPRWIHKTKAIQSAAAAFSQNLNSALSQLILVPVPPSKLKTDPEYDNRIMDMLSAMKEPTGKVIDARELIRQTQPMVAAHNSQNRPPPSDWEKVYEVDESLAQPEPAWIGIVDDLLVTGCRFRAMSNVLGKRFPTARITGLFLARRVPDAIDFSQQEMS